MQVDKENLLEELESIKHCVGMTHSNIDHEKTREYIVRVLENRISELEKEVDAKISAQGFGKLMSMDVA